jgi:hypothetical protein
MVTGSVPLTKPRGHIVAATPIPANFTRRHRFANVNWITSSKISLEPHLKGTRIGRDPRYLAELASVAPPEGVPGN